MHIETTKMNSRSFPRTEIDTKIQRTKSGKEKETRTFLKLNFGDLENEIGNERAAAVATTVIAFGLRS